MNVLLGTAYILPFFKWFIHAPRAIAFVAINSNPKVVGYAVGAPASYGRELNRDLFSTVLRQVLSRPSLGANTGFLKIAVGRLRSLLPLGSAPSEEPTLPEPRMSLVALATAPDQWRKGIGMKLMRAFMDRAEQLGMCSVSLSVYQDNVHARVFYDKSGWESCDGKKNDSSPTLTYYKVLPGIYRSPITETKERTLTV